MNDSQNVPDTRPVLAIVGSVRFTNVNAYSRALEEIAAEIRSLRPRLVVSGGADGMDTFAETVVRLHGVAFKAYPPANQRWEPAGFKERNMQIADACTHLLAIRCKEAKTYGSGWTADYAEKELGRHVRRVIV